MDTPSGDQAGSAANVETSGTTMPPSAETFASAGAPRIVVATAIDRPSGDHAGDPRGSIESGRTRVADPSTFMMYIRARPRSVATNAMRRPSGAIAGAPMMRAPASLHNSGDVRSVSFQMMS